MKKEEANKILNYIAKRIVEDLGKTSLSYKIIAKEIRVGIEKVLETLETYPIFQIKVNKARGYPIKTYYQSYRRAKYHPPISKLIEDCVVCGKWENADLVSMFREEDYYD